MKTFSIKKYIEYCKKKGLTQEYIDWCVKSHWAYISEGLTKEKMEARGSICLDDWLVDDKNYI